MKRLAFMLLLAVASALAAHAIYSAARPEKPVEVCTMDWLAGELRLTAAQYDAVWAIHVRRCAEICRLDAQRAQCSPAIAPSLENACRFATQRLIDEVCRELDPAQRQRYLKIVAPCLANATSLQPEGGDE